MEQKPSLWLIDGHGIAYRSYYAFINNPLINSKGQNTSVVFGFVNYLNHIIDEHKPEYIAVVFDTPEPTFRHKEFAEYKATRSKMPEDMSSMMDTLKEVIRAYNIPVLELAGYEADDIIGTLARRAEKEKVLSYLVTSDKDFMQLVSPLIRLYRPGKRGDDDEIIDEVQVVKKFGVQPNQIVDFLGLTGDTSDNVPGIPGIGPKSAEPLIQTFGTIENILSNINAVPKKGLQQKLQEHKDLAILSKRLVTIDTAVPVDIDFHSLRYTGKDRSKLSQIFSALEFRSFIRHLQEESSNDSSSISTSIETAPQFKDITNTPHTYTIIDTPEQYADFFKKIQQVQTFVFDTETTSTDALRADLVGISFCFEPHSAYYLPIKSASKSDDLEELFPKQHGSEHKYFIGFDIKQISKDLRPLFENPQIKKYGQNLKYDIEILSRQNILTRGAAFDTMIASYVLRENGRHSLDSLSMEYLGYKMISFDELTFGGKNDIRDIPVAEVGRYSAEDADMTYQLCDILHDKLASQNLLNLCREIEFPLIAVLVDMESTGVCIDTEFLLQMSKEFDSTLSGLVDGIHRDAGEQFNINSTQQLAVILFEKLKLPPVRKTKTGYSTDVGVLEMLQKEHPIVQKLLDYRQLSKLKSTYVDALPRLIHPSTGRVHTSFNQTVASTGRLSSSDPNLQNIPIRTEIGRNIRRAFIPSGPTMKILSADYSQIELRIMAHISNDKGLRDAFERGEDIHTSTAAKVFGVSLSDVNKDMRRKAKEVNFGIMYGIGPYGLASRLEITQTEAKEIISTYFARFPNVNQYIASTIALAREQGYVTTLKGRRRYLPDIHSRNANLRQNAERQAINMPIQGTAADMIKLAMIRIHALLQKQSLRSRMILQVHDELVFDVADEEEIILRTIVEDSMKQALPLSVPIEIDIGAGMNWLEAH